MTGLQPGAPLTGRQLVEALAELGVCRRTPDVVRQWIREEPACPIAEHGEQGRGHRYSLVDVMAWLRARALRERAKGFTRGGDGVDLVDRVDAATARLSGAPAAQQGLGLALPPPAAPAADTAPPAGDAAEAKRPAREVFDRDPTRMDEVEVLLEVMRGRDPRNWKAAEEALNARRKRLLEDRLVIPTEELQIALEDNVEHTRRSLLVAAPQLKADLKDLVPLERRHEMEALVDAAFAKVLDRLAATEDIDQVDALTSGDAAD